MLLEPRRGDGVVLFVCGFSLSLPCPFGLLLLGSHPELAVAGLDARSQSIGALPFSVFRALVVDPSCDLAAEHMATHLGYQVLIQPIVKLLLYGTVPRRVEPQPGQIDPIQDLEHGSQGFQILEVSSCLSVVWRDPFVAKLSLSHQGLAHSLEGLLYGGG